ncbi:MAG: hypothetical protein JSU65_08395 [Candidatus Zixiibacteriota bacterium]|nr:MAG: hypothetical protein JSU65_08395 [candidate division Zixibacteria bacterium]
MIRKAFQLFLVLCCVSVSNTGCIKKSTYIPTTELRRTDSGRMDVLAKDGTTYRLLYGQVTRDRLRGQGIKYLPDGTSEEFRGNIPLASVSLVQTSRPDVVSSLTAYGTIGVLAVASVTALDDDGTGLWVRVTYPTSGGSGSCPFVFTYDGQEYHFESETVAGAVCRSLERSNLEVLRYLKPHDGTYRLALSNQSPESQHTNELSVLAVDHPVGTNVVPDVRGSLHTVRNPLAPITAAGLDGTDCLEQILHVDDIMFESDLTSRDFNTDDQLRDGIICEFERPDGADAAKLIVNGVNTHLGYFALETLFSMRGPNKLHWYHELDNNPTERKKLIDWMMREGGLTISVWQNGNWVKQSWMPDVGPRVTAQKLAVLDLKAVAGSTVRIKLECATDLWLIDQVAMDYSEDEKIEIVPARLVQAKDDSDRDITEILNQIDTLYYSALPGDFALLSYEAVPEKEGVQRSFALKSTGYYYTWIEEDDKDSRDMVERILNEPLLGSRIYLKDWRIAREQYSAEYDMTPRFRAPR